MEGKAAEADQQHESDQEIMVCAPFRAWAKHEKRQPTERSKQKGDIARGIDGLRKQRRARSSLAIEEDMLAQCHGRSPFLLN
jgi:hypothetical protein